MLPVPARIRDRFGLSNLGLATFLRKPARIMDRFGLCNLGLATFLRKPARIMDRFGLSNLGLATFLRKKWAAVSLWLRTAAIPNRRSKESAFRKLPVEVILDIMGHIPNRDLRRLIRTDKFMNGIFKRHKRSIFKRMQRYQFPEFLECFGERPGFVGLEGPVSGDSRTSEQIQCLRDLVLSFSWQSVISLASGGIPARLFLLRLESFGGRKYLYFLQIVKHQMEEDAQRLRMISLQGRLDMTGEQAKAMVLCFSRMCWHKAAGEGDGARSYAAMSEVDRVAEVRMRVENRLKIFQKEPPALQELMRRTLAVLILRMAQALGLDIIVTRYQNFYRSVGMASLTMAQRMAGWDHLASMIAARTLLKCFFFYGVMNILRLCEEPFNNDIMEARTVIVWEFIHHLEDHLQAVASGTFPHVKPQMLEGSLLATGIDFPTFGWFVTD